MASGTTRPISMASGAYFMPIKFIAMFTSAGEGGTFSINWGQSTADAFGDAVMLGGSLMTYEKIA
jgi:hypothetical protein